ncbi:MAG: hypothetical protein RBU37_27605, partial [Myxococcota bacterium]|nr:hypothetical protein [Myxococcota bacterium]
MFNQFSTAHPPAQGTYDLQRTLSHEFGHTFNIGHPPYSVRAAMMHPSIPGYSSRSLWYWDKWCAGLYGGFRGGTMYSRPLSSIVGSRTVLRDSPPTVQVAAGGPVYHQGASRLVHARTIDSASAPAGVSLQALGEFTLAQMSQFDTALSVLSFHYPESSITQTGVSYARFEAVNKFLVNEIFPTWI